MKEQADLRLARRAKIYYVHSLICCIIMFGFGFLPPIGDITPLGMRVLGIFLGAVYGWVCVELVWPSILSMLALGVSGYTTVVKSFGGGFGDSIVLMTLFTFIFFSYIEKSGLMKFIANWFLSLKINTGRPWIFTFIMFFSAGLTGAFTGMYPVIIMFWHIFYGVCEEVGIPKRSPYAAFVLGGIVYFATIACVLFPFIPFGQIVIGLASTAAPDLVYTAKWWIIIGPILLLLQILGYMLMGKFIFKVDVSPLLNTKSNYLQDLRGQKISREEKIASIYLTLFILILVSPLFLPAEWAFTATLTNMSTLGAATLCLTAICFRRTETGERKIYFGNLVQQGVNWDMILLLAATMPVCAAMESDETGIIATLIGTLTPMVSSLSPVGFVIFCIVILCMITQFAHNLILILVFVPPLSMLCTTYGLNPIIFSLLLAYALEVAFGTPGGSAPGALVFGNTEWVSTKQAYSLGIAILLMSLLIFSLSSFVLFRIF